MLIDNATDRALKEQGLVAQEVSQPTVREARTALLAQAEGEDADDVILSWVQDAKAASMLTSALKIPVPVKSGTPPLDSLFVWADTEVTPIAWRVVRYTRETK